MADTCQESREGSGAAEREDNKLGVRPADGFNFLGVTDSREKERRGGKNLKCLKIRSCINYFVQKSSEYFFGVLLDDLACRFK